MRRTGERVLLTEVGWDRPLQHEDPDAPVADPAGREVLVAVEACGVCHRDLLDRGGRFPFQRVPIVPGHEAAGRVIAVGPEVRDWKIGDRVGTMHRDACGECPSCQRGETSLCERAGFVFGILADGGYARHLVAPESALYAVPEALSAAEAAVLHCTFGTAWRDLVTLGGMRSGDRVLVTGANGGVGAAAIQIAAHAGAEVIGVVRDERHVAFVKSLGAHAVMVDPGTTFHRRVPGGRVDVALDTVGVSTFNASLRSLRVGGRVVVIGNIVEQRAELNLGYIITSGLSVIGGSGATRREMAALAAAHERVPFHIAIDAVLPLAEAEQAQRRVRDGGLRGRIVLAMAPG